MMIWGYNFSPRTLAKTPAAGILLLAIAADGRGNDGRKVRPSQLSRLFGAAHKLDARLGRLH
jgi:hypothetical protein